MEGGGKEDKGEGILGSNHPFPTSPRSPPRPSLGRRGWRPWNLRAQQGSTVERVPDYSPAQRSSCSRKK